VLDERQLFVVHHDGLGGIERLRLGFGDHHRHRLADMTGPVGRQQRVRADEHGAAARRVQLHVELGLRHWIVRERRKLVGDAIGAGEHAEHAGHFLGRCRIDLDDARMRMRRAHHRRIGLPIEVEIVGKTTAPGDEPLVFLARQRLADEAEAGWVRSCRVVHRTSPAIAAPPRYVLLRAAALNPSPRAMAAGTG